MAQNRQILILYSSQSFDKKTIKSYCYYHSPYTPFSSFVKACIVSEMAGGPACPSKDTEAETLFPLRTTLSDLRMMGAIKCLHSHQHRHTSFSPRIFSCFEGPDLSEGTLCVRVIPFVQTVPWHSVQFSGNNVVHVQLR